MTLLAEQFASFADNHFDVGIVTAFAPLFAGRAPVLDDVASFCAGRPAP